MMHSQGLSNKSLSSAEKTRITELVPISLKLILTLSSHLRLGLPLKPLTCRFTCYILKALLASSILTILPVHLNLLDLLLHSQRLSNNP